MAEKDSMLLVQCAKLMTREANDAVDFFTRVREELEHAAEGGAKKKSTRASDTGLAEENRRLERQLKEARAEIQRLEVSNTSSDSELVEENHRLERKLKEAQGKLVLMKDEMEAQQAELEKKQKTVQEELLRLKEYNASLEKANQNLVKREKQLEERERHVRDVESFLQMNLAPTDQQPAKTLSRVERGVAGVDQFDKTKASRSETVTMDFESEAPNTLMRCKREKRSRARSSMRDSRSDCDSLSPDGGKSRARMLVIEDDVDSDDEIPRAKKSKAAPRRRK